MLRELSIENLAIIEEARITFGEGLNVLTGETGAGKSLLVAALELVLGERAKAEWIRADAEEARVEAVIDLEDTPELSEILADAGHAATDTLVVRRTVARSGKNRVYINDRAATLSFLEELGQRLADIHGQHEHQSLLRVKQTPGAPGSIRGTGALPETGGRPHPLRARSSTATGPFGNTTGADGVGERSRPVSTRRNLPGET